ncbi:methyltransferase domain-containing protein [Microbacteriaceae bacterium 4G12]
MATVTLSAWLRCPICFLPLEPRPPLSLACASGHSHDVNRRGYVTLLSPKTRVVGDDAAMLDARDAFLSTGHYRAIADAAAELLPADAGQRILDAGCGTGYYLRRALEDRPDAVALALDLSPAAVSRAVRGDDRIDGLVADVWAPLPVRDGAATAILNVFAPRNPEEFWRVLEPGGSLVVVVPDGEHLRELRDRGLVLGVQEEKRQRLLEALSPRFALDREIPVRTTLSLAPKAVSSLIGMGPSAHHRTGDAPLEQDTTITASVTGLRFLRRD